MMISIWWLVAATVVGVWLGVIAMAMMAVAASESRRMDDLERKTEAMPIDPQQVVPR